MSADGIKPIVFTHHARDRMAERGADENDVRKAIREGSRELARMGRDLYRITFEFDDVRHGKRYRSREVAAVVAEEPARLVVVTVFVFYVRGGGET